MYASPYPESVEFLYALGNEIRTAKLGLDSIRVLLAELGNPEKQFRIVHVAGTNGKGSTCAMIEAGLRCAGYTTGLYTSPHLIEPTERIQINRNPVSRDRFAQAFARVHEANERLISQGGLEHHTTYFETVTAMAFLVFAESAVDIAVVETGLGGRLDATNAVLPELCVITPVDFDHEAYLGNSISLIAAEKAGILKPQVPAVFARQRPEAELVLDSKARELRCPVVRTAEYRIDNLETGSRSSRFTVCRTKKIDVHCPLAGEHQIENALAAIAALEHLNVAPDISGAQWPGRLQVINERPELLLDGAHNPAGARALARHIRRFYTGRRIHLIYGAMRDKSVEEITEVLFGLAQEVVVTAPSSPRAVDPATLVAASEHPHIRALPSIPDALAWARAVPAEDVVVITGSLYLVGEVLALLQ